MKIALNCIYINPEKQGQQSYPHWSLLNPSSLLELLVKSPWKHNLHITLFE